MMTTFIVMMVEKETDKSLEQGQEKKQGYFVNTFLYTKWKPEIDTILAIDGYGDVILTEWNSH